MRFLAIGILTVATVLAILGTDQNGLPAQRQLSDELGYFVATASIGALIGIFTVRDHIGGEGLLGLITTIMAFYFATLVGGFIGGTLMFPILGTYFALAMLWSIPWTLANGAIAWWVGVLALHFVTLHLLPEETE